MRQTNSSDCQTKVKAVSKAAFVPATTKVKAHSLMRVASSLLLMLFLLSFPSLAGAQELAGTFTGTVTDPSGAVIPHATITITLNGVSGATRVVQSNESGNYTATNLLAGTYTITVSDPSFEKFSDRDVVLNVAQKRTVNAQLKVGGQNQTVTVEDNPVALDTETSSQAGTISGTQLRELELVNRNFQQLVTLQPGVVNLLGDQPGFGGINSTSSVSVNGARTTANNWSVDGADINDSGSNATLLNIPSVDAIQELTLERSSYDASFGRSGGGQILVATRSGTSSIHGSAYEFVRTANTNANNYFNNLQDIPRAPDHYNNFGFTVGGPIFIPHVYNPGRTKTFFFWSEEWRKITEPAPTNNVPAPTAAELNGTFFSPTALNAPAGCVSGYTPFIASTTGGTGTGGVGTIDINNPNCISKNAQVYVTQILSKFQANSTSVNPSTGFTNGNLVSSFSTLNNFRQDLVRVDHYFNDKLHFFARGMQDDAPSNLPTGLWGGANYPGVVNVGINAPGKNVVANLTWTISPKMVNEVEFAYSQGTIRGALSGPANSPSVLSALTNNLANPDPYGRIPSVSILDGSATVVSQGSAPYFERNLDRNIFDNFSVTLGNHTLRAGVTAQQLLKTEDASEGNPSFTFNTWGDFLLGNVNQYTQASRDIVPDLRFWNTEAYVQDDWKLNHRLTLNLGLRWTRFPSPSDAKNTLVNFDPLLYKSTLAPALDGDGNFVAGQAFQPSTYANGLIFPKGSACTAAQAISAQVSCSPYGSTVNPNYSWNFGPRVGFAYSPFGDGKTVLRGGFGVFFDRTLNGIWEQNAFGDPPLVQTTTIVNASFDNPIGAGSAAPPALGPNALTTTGSPDFKVPSYASYNLSVQQQLSSTMMFEIAYVGSVSRHLLGELDLNQPTLSTREDNPISPLNNIRPYLGYSDFHTRLPIFTSNYNSLQASLNIRTTRDLTLGIAYTWSKNLSDQANDRGTANTYAYNPKLDYGPSTLNEPQIFIANFVYKAPFFREQSGLTGHVLGGWELSGITTFNSGLSLTTSQPSDPFACAQPTTTVPADPTNPLCAVGSAAGTYPGGLGMVSPNADVVPRPDQISAVHLTKTQTQWFTTSSFATAQGHFGSSGVGNFLSPGTERIDLGLLKTFRFSERAHLQLRAEAFNLFNHTNFFGPGGAAAGGIDTNLASGTFGQALTAHIPRTMQFSGKMYF
ncbi:carboxypeptidase regulatory-like domain-containing protein [Granulicella sp. S190]|uniref:carboxypeptidase regulatory-like domain-containing protein n=1 Tax=Granulicella sp. S190 TaxID=1747226 RepID=UPI0020B12D7A|nr:carboxypeptidase regulatory-like domain-containing protein [Granulicella sp. S190]